MLNDFDEPSLREGVDLIIAGMLEHNARSKSLAESLQQLILLLVSNRGIKFTTNHRFTQLLDGGPATRRGGVSGKQKESDIDTVYRVWGENYHDVLGLDKTFDLVQPLSRLAHLADTLNQHPDQLSKYLNQYRDERLAQLRPGRRDRVTGNDILALNRDLRAIVLNTHQQYTSLLATRLDSVDRQDALERLGKIDLLYHDDARGDLFFGNRQFHRYPFRHSTSLRGDNIIIRDQDRQPGYPWATLNLFRKLEDVGLDPDELQLWHAPSDPNAPALRASVASVVAKHSTETLKFDVPRRVVFTPSHTGLRPDIAKTFGASANIIRSYQRSHVFDPWIDNDAEDEQQIWRERVKDLFPLHNGDRIGQREYKARKEDLGLVDSRGSRLRWGYKSDAWKLGQAQEKIEALASAFALEGSFNTAGLLEPLGESAHGTCLFIKLHYGHVLLFLVYEEYIPDDTAVPTEYHAGDVIFLQPGQRYMLYHCQCSLVTRGRIYHPARMLDKSRIYDPREHSTPFANPVLRGSISAMRATAGKIACDQVFPIFHQFMITIAGMLAWDDGAEAMDVEPEDLDELVTAMHTYIASPIFNYMPALQEDPAALSAVGKQYDPAGELVFVMRFCEKMQSYIVRQLKINKMAEEGKSLRTHFE
ncbi:hypothetical protein NCC49_005242 [Naganishia albida]|nr:hypothetical protein NCC49_005242 [Naganishia albida]